MKHVGWIHMIWIQVVWIAMLGMALPVGAHHSTRAEFDDRQIVTMRAVVRHVSWLNPHANILVAADDPPGTEWRIELPSPIGLIKRGWNRDDLKAGDRVTLAVWLAKNGSKLASMRTITLADGRTVSGSSPWDNPVRQP